MRSCTLPLLTFLVLCIHEAFALQEQMTGSIILQDTGARRQRPLGFLLQIREDMRACI